MEEEEEDEEEVSLKSLPEVEVLQSSELDEPVFFLPLEGSGPSMHANSANTLGVRVGLLFTELSCLFSTSNVLKEVPQNEVC